MIVLKLVFVCALAQQCERKPNQLGESAMQIARPAELIRNQRANSKRVGNIGAAVRKVAK